ncbi:MAG: hypothetical protein GF403_11355 [Candidatus Coatesbacteria bacterium]|nr:hypothetical protein [Candidatus Coatesbacteria bacterium]
MGEKIAQIYDFVREKGKFIDVMRLAMVTKITRPEAKEIPDDPDVISKVRMAAMFILETDDIP